MDHGSVLESGNHDELLGMGMKASEIVRYAAQAFTALLIPFFVSWKLTLVCLATFPVLLASIVFAKKTALNRAIKNQLAYQNANNIAIESISGIKLVQSLPESLCMIVSNYVNELTVTYKAGK
eukprot:Pgem_evm1s10833